jgi:hypothetical protein
VVPLSELFPYPFGPDHLPGKRKHSS